MKIDFSKIPCFFGFHKNVVIQTENVRIKKGRAYNLLGANLNMKGVTGRVTTRYCTRCGETSRTFRPDALDMEIDV